MPPHSPHSLDSYVIVDPHVAVAGLLVYYLKAAIPSLESNGHFGSARAVLEELPKLKPRLVIIELSLGDGLGLSVLRQLRAKLSNTAWLLFTGNPRIGIQDAIKLGVQGCVSKSASLPEILEGVQSVLRGEQFFCRATTTALADIVRRADLLTRTEKMVLAAYANGMRPKEIAAEVKIGVKSVHNLTASIRAKLVGKSGSGSLVELAHYA